jgi:hypothetical protein
MKGNNMTDADKMTKLARLLRLRGLIKMRAEKRGFPYNYRLGQIVAELDYMLEIPDGALVLLPARYAGIEMETRV